MSHRAENDLRARFHCPKCKSHVCHVGSASLPSGKLPLPVTGYYVVTCGLCGFTEFYNQSVFETLEEPNPKTARVPVDPAADA
ncbi:MAG: hypothetical protein RLY93_09965 [Sumerlaeia bacterium]